MMAIESLLMGTLEKYLYIVTRKYMLWMLIVSKYTNDIRKKSLSSSAVMEAKFMYQIDKKQQLKDFAKAVAIPVGLTDSAKWPVRAGTVIFPVRNILVHEFIDQIYNAGIVGNEVSWRKAFDGPTQLWRMTHHMINGLLDDHTDRHEVASTILIFLEGIASLSYDHYFEALGNHIILSDDALNIALNVHFENNRKAARLALLLSGLIWSFSETNYFVAHELTCEYHGPYKLSDGNFALIRDFKNTSPSQLWPERDYGGLPANIQIITIHDGSLEISFDTYNNLYDDSGTMASSLLSSSVISDGNEMSISEVQGLILTFSKKITDFSNQVDAMNHNQVAKKYMEVFWYRKKSLSDYMGISWKPSAYLYDVLENGLKRGPEKKAGTVSKSKTTPEYLAKYYDFSDDI